MRQSPESAWAASIRRFSVLRLTTTGSDGPQSYRVTHVFDTCIFVMPILPHGLVNSAPRPKRWSRNDTLALLESEQLVPSVAYLPSELATSYEDGSEEDSNVQAAMRTLAPLLEQFNVEANLGRCFTRLIRERAEELALPEQRVRRLLLRFWQFGGIPQAVLEMRRGPAPSGPDAENPGTHNRRGRPSTIEALLARPAWVADEQDVLDMVKAAKRCKGGTREDLARAYLTNEFKKRHPAEYQRYATGIISNPCSGRLIQNRLNGRDDLPGSVLQRFPFLHQEKRRRNLFANGPGDAYELDATGGQIFVIDPTDPSVILGALTIYLMIDRWSRYVVSVYATLRPPSSSGVRQTLRIAFMPRGRRFQNLGANVSDEAFPVAVKPLQITFDRGSDMLSMATVDLAVKDLNCEAVHLPPYTPDGKAIIERVIETLKTRLKAKIGKSAYAKFITSPHLKGLKQKALVAACHSLRDVYGALVDICVAYNNEIHSTLRRELPELAQAGLEATPKQAYLFGLKHVSGLDSSVLSIRDLDRLTLEADVATLTTRGMMWKQLLYRPANREARQFHRTVMGSSRRAKGGIQIKIDKSDPVDLFVRSKSEDWPRWELTSAGLATIAARSIEEVDFFETRDKFRTAAAQHEAARRRTVSEVQNMVPSKPAIQKRDVSAAHRRRRNVEQSEGVDTQLGLSRKRTSPAPPSAPSSTGFTPRTKQERQTSLDALVARREKK